MEPAHDALLRTAVAVALDRRAAYDELDAAAGDGDFGSTLARGAAALAADPPDDLRAAAQVVVAAMGGSSGPLLAAALIRVGDVAGKEEPGTTERRNPSSEPAALVRAAIDGIGEYGEAERGDKTVLDALYPLAEALEAGEDPVAAAREGADATAEQTARRGRASYAGERSQGAPDPGAVAVAEIAEALRDGEPPSWGDLAGRAPDDDAADEDQLVELALAGLERAHADRLERLPGRGVIVRRDRGTTEGRVALVSGGGAGHEPLHAGFVGAGMLDAACPGAVFTSPAPDQMVAAAEAVDAGGGVLFVVKNYTGDVLNFRLAAELLEGRVQTRTALIADDVASAGETGARGTGATIAVEKVAGARAAAGGTLEEVHAVAERVRARSYGIAFHDEEMEVGVGIHGEPGERRPRAARQEVVEHLHTSVLDALEPDQDVPLLAIVSGLGGTPQLELLAALELLGAELGDRLRRTLVGDLITSMDQPGIALTLVELDDELLELWDAPVWTPALRW